MSALHDVLLARVRERREQSAREAAAAETPGQRAYWTGRQTAFSELLGEITMLDLVAEEMRQAAADVAPNS